MVRLLISVVLFLTSCVATENVEPHLGYVTYKFRGYDSQSSCEEVKNAELRRGGTGAESAKEGGGRIYRMDSDVYGFDTNIRIRCDAMGNTSFVSYVVEQGEGADFAVERCVGIDLDSAFDSFHAAASRAFGDADIDDTDSLGPFAEYLCKDGFLVQLILERSNMNRALQLNIHAGDSHCT